MRAETLRVYETVMALPDDDRAELAAALVDSIGRGASEKEVLASWVAETKRRIEDFEAGRSEMIPFEDVDAEIRAQIDAARAAKG